MTANDIMRAIAARLGEIYPERLVYVRKIEQGADGNHFVRVIDQAHGKLLDRRRRREYSFEVLYFRKGGDALEFNDWAETMYTEFETLTLADGQILHVTGANATDGDDGVFHFVFDVNFTALVAPAPGEPMAGLEIKEGLKL